MAAAAREFCLHPQVARVYGEASIVDEVGLEVSRWDARPFDLKTMLTSGSIVPQPATFFARSIVADLGFLNESRQMIMDYELCTRIGARFPTICLPRTLARFRAHDQSKTHLQFETTARELVDFVMSFRAESLTEADWIAIRNATLGRVHFEWAMGYVVRGQHGGKALRQLLTSIRLHPGFALGRPLLAAHIVKQVVLGYLRPTRAA